MDRSEGERRLDGELSGIRALVTGGASGIGLAVAQRMLRQGARVAVLDRVGVEVVHGDGDTAGIEEARRLVYVQADVTDDAGVRTAVSAALAQLGGLDVLVNNAGVGAQGDVTANEDAEWLRVLDVNVVGLVRVTRAALPALRESPRAAIVNVGSIVATAGLPQRALYSASKGAVQALTMAMAADLVAHGIRVTCVNPGTADTPWVANLLQSSADPVAERAALEARQPHGRLVSADEVAHAICYLASPAAGSTTGTVLAVDGGMDRLRPRPAK